jgi:hypothetical protein
LALQSLETPETIATDTIPVTDESARVLGIYALLLAPVAVPLYLILVFTLFSFAADAWSGLRASLGF